MLNLAVSDNRELSEDAGSALLLRSRRKPISRDAFIKRHH
jgi:hypothetical protein